PQPPAHGPARLHEDRHGRVAGQLSGLLRAGDRLRVRAVRHRLPNGDWRTGPTEPDAWRRRGRGDHRSPRRHHRLGGEPPVAAGLDRLGEDCDLAGLAYYHRGVDGNVYERLAAGMILGCSLLTGRGVPCGGEGDLKNCMAMKVMDTLGAGGSYTELYAMDFQ